MFHNRFVLALLQSLLVLALGIQIDALDSGAPHTVPLNAIYASFDQDDLNSCNDVVAKADLGDPLDALRDGPARIVLCVGSDIAAAGKILGENPLHAKKSRADADHCQREERIDLGGGLFRDGW